MDCADVERALIEGTDEPSGAVRAHADTCESCRFLVGDGRPLARVLNGSAPRAEALDLRAFEADLFAELAAERGPVAAARTLSRPIRTALTVALMVLGALFFYVMMRRPDWDIYDPARMALTLGSLGVAGLALTWVSLRPLYLPPLAERTLRGVALAGALIPAVLSILPEVPGGLSPPGFSYLRSGYLCFSIGAGMSLLCLIAARALDRGGHRGAWTGILAALGAGMVGVAAGQIFCPVNYPLHLLTGHATIPLALALGTLVLRKT